VKASSSAIDEEFFPAELGLNERATLLWSLGGLVVVILLGILLHNGTMNSDEEKRNMEIRHSTDQGHPAYILKGVCFKTVKVHAARHLVPVLTTPLPSHFVKPA